MRLASILVGDFVQWSDECDADDAFVNVADLQRARNNHNAILAKRSRRTVLSQTFTDLNGALDTDAPIFYSPVNFAAPMQWALFDFFFYLSSPFVTSLTVVIEAKKESISGFSDDIDIYPHVQLASKTRPISAADKLTVTSTSLASYSVTVPVPLDEAMHAGARPIRRLQVFADCRQDYSNSPKSGPYVTSIRDASHWSVDDTPDAILSTCDVPGCVAINTSNTEIAPVRVLDIRANGNEYELVTEPLNVLPAIGDDISFRQIMGLYIASIDVYENGSSDFFSQRAVLR